MPSNQNEVIQSWNDPRYFFSLLIPFGALVWAGAMIWGAIGPYLLYFTEREAGGDPIKKAVVAILFALLFFIGLYYTVGLYQVFFIELKEKFIVRKARYCDGEFELKGYYFKSDSFHAVDVVSVEEVRADPRWFSKRTGTLLTRNPKLRYNFSLKVTLKNGRTFYFPGEMGDLHGLEELRTLLEAFVQVQNGV